MSRICILFVLALCLLAPVGVNAQDSQTTTFFVVRHADRNGQKDELTKAGEQRAEVLRDMMKMYRVSAVYSTKYERTQKTAAPTAKAINVPVTTYDQLTKAWFDELKKKHAGKAVLIVGHSNTSGHIAAGLGGEGDFSISENEYDSLFVVTITKSKPQSVRLRFGADTSQD